MVPPVLVPFGENFYCRCLGLNLRTRDVTESMVPIKIERKFGDKFMYHLHKWRDRQITSLRLYDVVCYNYVKKLLLLVLCKHLLNFSGSFFHIPRYKEMFVPRDGQFYRRAFFSFFLSFFLYRINFSLSRGETISCIFLITVSELCFSTSPHVTLRPLRVAVTLLHVSCFRKL